MAEVKQSISQIRQPRIPYSEFSVTDWIKYCVLKLALTFIYLISHLYDYLFYPIYCIFQHPWIIRRYGKSIHSRWEVVASSDNGSGIIYRAAKYTLPRPIEAISDFKLDTMQKVFRHLGKSNSKLDCIGTREILASEDEVQPETGRVFQKYVLGKYNWINIAQFKERVCCLANALVGNVGIKSHEDKVAILAETRADWLVTAFACFNISTPLITLYTNLGVESIIHAINETEVSTLVCSADTIDKVKEVLQNCPHVQNLIVMDTLVMSDKSAFRRKVESEFSSLVKKNLVFLEDLVDMVLSVICSSSTDKKIISESSSFLSGDSVSVEVDARHNPSTNDCAIIMYTSGSTGKPKGVMISHGNLVSAILSITSIVDFSVKDRYIGYLPLAHVLELLAETSCLMFGIKIAYSSPLTLTNKSSKVKAGCKGDANLFRPTIMCVVPLILERIYKSIVDTVQRQGWAAAELFDYLVKYKMKWQDRGFDTPILNHTLFRKIRYFVGGRVRVLLCGGAPLSDGCYELTRTCLCVPLMQGYGLTETAACATLINALDRSTGRVGVPLPNVSIKLVNWSEGGYLVTDKPNPRGEIHVGGENVSSEGYYGQKELTEKEFYNTPDGTRWFKTGDIGEFDKDGILKIIDRCKDLVKLQGGEYVSYGKIEPVLKNCPLVESICVYADPLKDYTIAIVILSSSSTGVFVPKLPHPRDNQVDDKAVLKVITDHGKRNGLLRFEIPQKIIITEDEWTPDSGLVTAAFKIRRRQVVEKYKQEIDAIYV